MIFRALFFIAFGGILFTYIGYPVYLYLLSRMAAKPILKQAGELSLLVTVIIAAKNEESHIEKRIQNLLEQDYPSSKIEIIVVSDGSNDDTPTLVRSLADSQGPEGPSIVCLEYAPSRGKASALNMGVERASGEIIVFTDARQSFEKNVLTELIANFSDGSVGGVSGELIFLEEGDKSVQVQMGAYWNYEKRIRKMESATGSVVGVTGAIYAIRKELYRPLLPETLLDDVVTPMNIVMQGYRVVFDSEARAYDVFSATSNQEWRRKVRTLAGVWQLLSIQKKLLSIFKNPLLFRFLSHKLARLFVPFFLLLLLGTGLSQNGQFFTLFSLLQIVFYLIALSAFLVRPLRRLPGIGTVYFFCVLNTAVVKAFWVWVSGNCATVWTERS